MHHLSFPLVPPLSMLRRVRTRLLPTRLCAQGACTRAGREQETRSQHAHNIKRGGQRGRGCTRMARIEYKANRNIKPINTHKWCTILSFNRPVIHILHPHANAKPTSCTHVRDEHSTDNRDTTHTHINTRKRSFAWCWHLLSYHARASLQHHSAVLPP